MPMKAHDSQQIKYDVIPSICKNKCDDRCQQFCSMQNKVSFSSDDLPPCGLPVLFERHTDDEVFAGQLWSCPQIVRRFIDRDMTASDIDFSISERTSISENPLLTKRVQLTWEQYQLIEDFLTDILSLSNLSFFNRLIALRIVVLFIESLVSEYTGKFQPMERNRCIPEGITLLQKWLVTIRHNFNTLIVPAATKDIRLKQTTKRVLLGYFISICSIARDCPDLSEMVFSRIRCTGIFLKYYLGWGQIPVFDMNFKCKYNKADSIYFDMEDYNFEKVLRTYYLHLIHRKDALVFGSLQKGIDFFILTASMLRILSGAFSLQSQPDTHFSSKHSLMNAISMVEILFWGKNSIVKILNDNPAIDNLFMNIASEVHYPYLLLR